MEKILPHYIDAEQTIIASILHDPEQLEIIAPLINSKDFYGVDHRFIWGIFINLVRADKPIDLLTLREYLENQHDSLLEDRIEYLDNLMRSIPKSTHLGHYVKQVKRAAFLRALINCGNEIISLAHNPGQRTSQEILDSAEQKIGALSMEENLEMVAPDVQAIGDILKSTCEKINFLHKNPTLPLGLKSGLRELDTLTSGFNPGEFIILAARPSMGKTALALNMAYHAIKTQSKGVIIFSLEMPADQLGMRLLAGHTEVPLSHIRTGQLTPAEWARLAEAMTELGSQKLFIDAHTPMTIMDLRLRARRIAKESGKLGLIVIDYLQLLQSEGNHENRHQEVSTFSRLIKSLAKELDVPILALSQLNRSLEQRADKRPIMSDLRESGSLEQDADTILMLYRDGVYNKRENDNGLAELLLVKQRNGPTGTVKLTFLPSLCKFENWHKPTCIPASIGIDLL